MKEPRAPRMVKLFVDYSKLSKEAFVHDGISGNVAYAKHNIPGAGYNYPVVRLHANGVTLLEIHGSPDVAPRTKIYVEEYSDRLDCYMNALLEAVVALDSANEARVDEDNRRRKEQRLREEGLF